MRVLQLIDSLAPGGAEQMAVNFANALPASVEGSYICATRAEGELKGLLDKDVGYQFLNKKSSLDIGALLRLRKWIKKERITIIHAHGTSFFFGTLLRMIYPKVMLVWHTHLGSRVVTQKKANRELVMCSHYFDHIITVNEDLKTWCLKNLACDKVDYLPNFVDVTRFQNDVKKEKTIVYVANLKNPKNHMNLLKAFQKVSRQFEGWNLQLAGRKFHDNYSEEIENYISEHNLTKSIEILGLVPRVEEIISRASIGAISSDSEGLPMALLEYGAAGLAVVSTNVGYCEKVIDNYGITVPKNDSNELAKALTLYLSDPERREKDALRYHQHISNKYSIEAVIPKLLEIYKYNKN